MAHVLLTDLVGYSRLPMAEQRTLIQALTQVVRSCEEFGRAEAADQLVCLPTGDGMALVFFDDPEAPIRCAIQIANATADNSDIQLRMGIHSGPVYRVEDINAMLNISGGGVNICQRVMDSGDAGHILVSSTAKELLGQIRDWDLQPLGEHEVKHGLKVTLFNLCSEGVGNPEIPSAIQKARAVQAGAAPQAPATEAPPAHRPAVVTAPPAKPKPPKPKLVLPSGCSWDPGEPPEDCPHDDPEAYTKWVSSHGPVQIRHDETGIELVWVPGGTLMMGSVRGREDEKPVRRERFDGFWIGRTPITVRQWELVMQAAPAPHNDQGAQHPVAGVTWEECREFCRRTGLALPPEGHWEYAARGREGRVYPWGGKWDASSCQNRENLHGYERTAPAGSQPKNVSWCGVRDMAGNVWEWCRDWYYPTPQQAASGQPTGRKSLRGGASASDSFECRSSCRLSAAPNNRSPLIGVRIARPKAK